VSAVLRVGILGVLTVNVQTARTRISWPGVRTVSGVQVLVGDMTAIGRRSISARYGVDKPMVRAD
jgi:hypothetical protein